MASKKRTRVTAAHRAIALAELAPKPTASPGLKVTVGKEKGVPGTVNYSGRIRAEVNPELVWERAYGIPGALAWGEWENLHRTDPAIATAFSLIAAPLRDCEVTVEPAKVRKPKTVGKAPSGPDGAALGDQSATPPPGAPEGSEKPAPAKPGGQVTKLAEPPAENKPTVTPPEGKEDLPEGESPGEETLPGEESDPEAELQVTIAEFVEENMREHLAPGWPALLYQMVVYGLGYGHYLAEKVYGTRPDDRVPGGTAQYLAKLVHRLPSSIKPDGWKEKDGDLFEVHQAGVKDGKWENDIALPARSILLATWDRSGNNYAGYPAIRSVWFLGKLRAKLLKILAIGHEREALGVPVVEIDKDTQLNPDQVTALETLVQNLAYHEKAGAVLPRGVTMNWVFSQGANKGHVLDAWRQLGTAMLEVVQAEQSVLGTGDTGSRSVGDTKTATKNGFVEGVRAWIEAAFNGVGDQVYTGVVKEIVDLNFGPQLQYPKLRLVTKKTDLEIGAFASAVKTLSDAGALTLTEQDENDIRERLGLAPVDPVARQAEKDRKEAVRQQIAGQVGAPSPGGDKPGLSPAGDKPPEPAKFAAQRAKTLAEILVDDDDA